MNLKAALRIVVLPILAVSAIVGLLIYVDSGASFPLLIPEGSQPVAEDGGFYSLESQGIKLGASDDPPPEAGKPAPDFTLRSLDGEVVSLGDFRGQTVVLNFWATWCGPCRREFPEFVEAYERNKDRGLVILAVNLRENTQSVREFASDFGATFPVLLDADGSVASQYRLRGLPVTWFIDAQGFARLQIIGLVSERLLQEGLAAAGFISTTSPCGPPGMPYSCPAYAPTSSRESGAASVSARTTCRATLASDA
jgi:peroxiredoxin